MVQKDTVGSRPGRVKCSDTEHLPPILADVGIDNKLSACAQKMANEPNPAFRFHERFTATIFVGKVVYD